MVWGQENDAYRQAADTLFSDGMEANAVVMVANPPGFYLASGNPAIAVPNGDLDTLLNVAKRYGAKFLILEAGSTPLGLMQVYDHPAEQPGLKYLSDQGGLLIYVIQP